MIFDLGSSRLWSRRPRKVTAAIRSADIDLDGRIDLVFSCEGATGQKSGVSWYRVDDDRWTQHDVSGRDGDLDIVTTEENDNLGVIWYENPARAPKPLKADK